MNATRKNKRPYAFHPWEKWFGAGKFELVRGRDYNGRTDSLIQQIRNAAGPRRFNLALSIQVSDNGERITVHVLGEK